jgi:HAD superfamily hydrolase (TIGR01549 family)
MFKAAIFDVDGTLVDSVDLHARAWQEAFTHFGYQTRFEEVRSQIGKGADQLVPVFVPEKDLDRIYDELERYRSNLFKSKYLQRVKGFPRVRELFQKLIDNQKQIALASSAKGDELSHYKRVAGISDVVAVEVTADNVARSKPQPDIFQAVLRKLGQPSTDSCVVVGDTPYDVIAAKGAGLSTVGLLCGGFPESALREAGAVAVYADPEALLLAYSQAGDAAFEADVR